VLRFVCVRLRLSAVTLPQFRVRVYPCASVADSLRFPVSVPLRFHLRLRIVGVGRCVSVVSLPVPNSNLRNLRNLRMSGSGFSVSPVCVRPRWSAVSSPVPNPNLCNLCSKDAGSSFPRRSSPDSSADYADYADFSNSGLSAICYLIFAISGSSVLAPGRLGVRGSNRESGFRDDERWTIILTSDFPAVIGASIFMFAVMASRQGAALVFLPAVLLDFELETGYIGLNDTR